MRPKQDADAKIVVTISVSRFCEIQKVSKQTTEQESISDTCCGMKAKRIRATKKHPTARTRNTKGKCLIHIRTHQGTWLSGDRLDRHQTRESIMMSYSLDGLHPTKPQ